MGAPATDRREAEQDWVEARNAGTIPPELFALYEATQFLSMRGLSDEATSDQKIVSIHFGRMMRSLKESLVQAQEHLAQIREQSVRAWKPLLDQRIADCDLNACRRQRSAFRYFVIDLIAVLDAIADIAGTLMPRKIALVSAGSGSFSALTQWLERDITAGETVMSPGSYYAERLHQVLKPIVAVQSGPETDWFKLLSMYRNKAAHLGPNSFPYFVLESSATGEMFQFLPRSWPFVIENYSSYGLAPAIGEFRDYSDLLHQWLLECDLGEYSDGAFAKVRSIVAVAAEVFRDLYVACRGLPAAEEAWAALQESYKGFRFRHFEGAG